MSEQKLVPELRFPEFEGDWEIASLGSYAELISGTHLAPDEYENKGEVPYFTGPSDFTNSLDEIEKWTKKKRNQAIYGDVLITVKGNGVGLLWPLMLNRVAMGRQLMAIRSKPSAEASFIFQLLSMYKQQYQALASGNLIPGLSRPDILGMKLSFPIVLEQQKIADFLSSVDAKLAKLSRKKALLDDYKRGLMQQIFSQKLRFKQDDGSEFPEWESTILSEVASFSKGKNISKDDIVEDGETLCIRYGELYTQYSEKIQEVVSRTNLPKSELVFSFEQDVIIPSSGESHLDIATASCVLKEGIALGGDLNIIRGDFNGVFLAYYLNIAKKKDIACLAQGNSVVHLYISQLSTLKVSLPSIEEQQKIADFLSSFDQKINVVSKQMEQLESFKKGLLQKLFV